MGDTIDIEVVPIAELAPDPLNPRQISPAQMESLRRSLEEFGAVEPAVVNADGTIVGGHQRIEAARALGWETFPIVRVDLSADRARVLNLALNKISGDWDEARLIEMLTGLAEVDDLDLTLSGFSEEEIAALLDGPKDLLTDPDDVPPFPAKPKTKSGDLWLLGEHRILCGDATSGEDMGRLMGGVRARMLFTDPPWNVAIGKDSNPRHRQRAGLVNDDLSSADFGALLQGFAQTARPHVDGDVYVILGASEWPRLDAMLRAEGFHWSATIIWVKDLFVLGRSKYHRRYEPIWYGWLEPGTSSFGERRDLDDVWEIPRPRVSPEHPTMKPVELMARALANSSAPGDGVLDPFGGSGSTLIAAEQTGRTAYLMEIDPAYCDVIVKRWENATGEKATRAT